MVSFVSLQRLDHYYATAPQQPPVAPRDIGPLIAVLDREHLNRVYATYWVTYRLDFDTRERIIAAQSKLERIFFENGRAAPFPNPNARWKPYERRGRQRPARRLRVLQGGARRGEGDDAGARRTRVPPDPGRAVRRLRAAG